MTNLVGKTALITGASRGIGAATAHHLASQGAHVMLAARSKSDLETVASGITDMGGRARTVLCDVADYQQMQAAVATTVNEFGSVDILVNNAGIIDPIARITDSDPDAWAAVIDVNVKGVYHGLRAALPLMATQESGTIVNISSGAATSALEGWSHYCASKAAVLSLTRCANREYRDLGITVVGLSPGTVATNMQQSIRSSGINPVSQIDWSDHIPAEWAAQAIAFLCGPDGHSYAGTDFSIKTDEGRRLVGLTN